MDKLFLSSRGQGKTLNIIKECSKNENSIIVCPNKKSVEYLNNLALIFNIKIPTPITFHQYINNYLRGTPYTTVYFDEIELCLLTLGTSIGGMSIDTTNVQVNYLDDDWEFSNE